MTHPWLNAHWTRLVDRLRADRLPHGLMLAGPGGLGKGALAQALASSLLCETPNDDGTACGNCHGCRMFAAGTHPDYQHVTPEEPGSQIKVDQVRELIRFMALSRQYERYKVAIIEPAEAMNPNAANSLLKTLEEPSAQSVLILVTSQPSVLPATIRSRCQRIDIRAPRPEEGLAWLAGQGLAESDAAALLKQANHAPLLALQLAEEGALEAQADFFTQFMDVLRGRGSAPALAEKWRNGNLERILAWQIEWVDAMIRFLETEDLSMTGEPATVLSRLAPLMGTQGLFDLRDQLIQYRRMLTGNLNAQMMLEDILQAWTHTLDQGKRKTA